MRDVIILKYNHFDQSKFISINQNWMRVIIYIKNVQFEL